MLQNTLFRFGNHTHVGQVRSQNEDYMGFFENENGACFVVCDGMGGHKGGATASQTAVQAIRDFFEKKYYEHIPDALTEAIQYANHLIYEKAQQNPDLKGMGTTCVVLLVRANEVYHAHVGDSRVYGYFMKALHRLTKDHSYVQQLVDEGVITEEQMETHPRRNQILRALGVEPYTLVDVCVCSLHPQRGDAFLLCSDGLCGLVSDAGIKEILEKPFDIQTKCIELINTANALGGHDNITVQLVEFVRDTSIKLAEKEAKNYTHTQPNFDTDTHTEDENDFSVQKKKRINPENIKPISEQKIQQEEKISQIMEGDIPEDYDFKPLLQWVFGGLAVFLVLFILFEKVSDGASVFGKIGNGKRDSLRAVEIQDNIYAYFWDKNPNLKKARDKIIELNELKKKILGHERFNIVRNSLDEENLKNLAKRYGSQIEWILHANKCVSEYDLKKLNLDSLIIPTQAPRNMPKMEEKEQEKQEQKDQKKTEKKEHEKEKQPEQKK